MSDAVDMKPTESGGTKYAAPQAMRLGAAGVARGFDCLSGSAAPSLCAPTGNDAQSCQTGQGTLGAGACIDGNNAANCATYGNTANGSAGCHAGNSATTGCNDGSTGS
jgi:hypothetical protein